MMNKSGIGDKIGQALGIIGVTDERVERWLGRKCGCSKRRAKLNQLGRWANHVLSGKREDAEKYLDDILNQE